MDRVVYQIIRRVTSKAKPYVGDVCNLSASTVEAMQDAGFVGDWPDGAKISSSNAECDGELDDFVINNALLPVVTARLKEFVDGHDTGGRFSWLPIQVEDSVGGVRSCHVLNTHGYIDGALERKQSNLVASYSKRHPNLFLRNKVQAAFKVAIYLEKVSGCDLYRISDYPGVLFASERFRAGFIENGFTGVGFAKQLIAQ